MKHCVNCGGKIDENDEYCTNCGQALKPQSPKLICPYCKSEDVKVQLITRNKKTGCFTIFIYIFY